MKSSNVSFDLKRFAGIKRDYSKEDVEKLKGTFNIEYTLCKSQSEKLWNLLNTESYVNTLGSLSGNQAVHDFTIFTKNYICNIFLDFPNKLVNICK